MTQPASAARGDPLRLVLLLGLVTLASLHRFWNGQVWDDANLLELTHNLSAQGRVLDVFTHSTLGLVLEHARDFSNGTFDLYRPMSLLSLALDRAVGGDSLFAFHATNLALHLGSVLLVLRIARALLPDARKPYAWLAAACFGVSPHLAEAHVWISGRFDEICTTFGLLSLWMFIEARAARRPSARASWITGAALAFFVGLLGKEASVFTLPAFALLPGGQAPAEKLAWRARVRDLVPFAGALLAYLAMRMHALHGSGSGVGSTQALLLAFAHWPLVICDSVASLLLPMNVYSRMLVEDYAPLGALGLVLGAVGCVVIAFVAFRARATAPVFVWSLVWLACTLLPVALIATRAWPGFGRFLYLPATMFYVGVADVLASVLERHPRYLALSRPVLGAYVAMLAFGLFVYTSDFESDDVLFESIIEHAPNRSHGYGFLGITYLERKRYADAAVLLRKADELLPNERRYLQSLGQALLFGGQIDEARAIADRGMQHFPAAPEFHLLRAYTWIRSDFARTAQDVVGCLRIDLENHECREAFAFLAHKHPAAAEFRVQFSKQAATQDASHAALARLLREQP